MPLAGCLPLPRYFGELLRQCRSEWVPIQTNAMVCLSNALYYNDDNRRLLEDLDGGVGDPSFRSHRC